MTNRLEGFPRNIILDTFEGRVDIDANLNADQQDALENVLNEVAKDRYKMAVDLYYREMLPYHKCAEIMGVSPERVRQMIRKVHRRMLNPIRSRLIIYGMNGYEEKRRKEKEEFERTHKRVKVSVSPMDRDVDEIGISAGSYWRLHDSGVKTVGDIVALAHDGLMKVRGIGAKKAAEIEDAVAKYLETAEGYEKEVWVEV